MSKILVSVAAAGAMILAAFRVEEHLSSVAEAMRVLLWRALSDQPEPERKVSSQKREP